LGTENAYTIREMGANSASLSNFGLVSLGPYLLPDRLIAYRHRSFMGLFYRGCLKLLVCL